MVNACLANGRGEGAEFLAERGAEFDLEGAAGVGRLDIVESFFNSDGRLTPDATREQANERLRSLGVRVRPARRRRVPAASEAWTQPRSSRHHETDGLHWAAYGGHADIVRMLIAHGAPINVKDETFEGTPLGWALHAWAGGGPHAGDSRYYDVVKLLVAAGATVEEEWLNEDERGLPIAKTFDGTRRCARR